MVLRSDDDDIWYWYEIVEQFRTQNLTQKEFCDKYKVDPKKFMCKLFRIVYKKERYPELYKKWLPITREYLTSDISPQKFVKTHDINIRFLGEMATHLRYLDTIERIKKQKENQSMNFIQVPTMSLPMVTPQEPEKLKKQNDIELIISQGVKVIVSPEVGADKLIRIIELLKDL